jgi:hypothetical protein
VVEKILRHKFVKVRPGPSARDNPRRAIDGSRASWSLK